MAKNTYMILLNRWTVLVKETDDWNTRVEFEDGHLEWWANNYLKPFPVN